MTSLFQIHSSFDTKMYLMECNSTDCSTDNGALEYFWTQIQTESTNYCWGDDCYDGDYPCAIGTSETFTMQSLDVGSYLVLLTAYDEHYGGDWQLEVFCGPPTTTTTSQPTSEPTAYVSPTIECDEVLSSTLSGLGYEIIVFNLTEEQDVTFTNCDRF